MGLFFNTLNISQYEAAVSRSLGLEIPSRSFSQFQFRDTDYLMIDESMHVFCQGAGRLGMLAANTVSCRLIENTTVLHMLLALLHRFATMQRGVQTS